MTERNKFTQTQIRAITSVGRKIEAARLEKGFSTRGAADRTITASKRGHISEATWRRIEVGYTKTGAGTVYYRPSPATLVAIAEVVGLDGAALCKELGLKPPLATPKRRPRSKAVTLEQIETALQSLIEDVARLREE